MLPIDILAVFHWCACVCVCVCVRVYNIHIVKGHRSKESAIPEPQAECPASPDKPTARCILFVGDGFLQFLADRATFSPEM